MKHVMVDLETMSTASNASIIAIGAVEFDPENGWVDRDGAFYRNVDLESSMRSGLAVDSSTIYWWLEQSDEARIALISTEPVELHQALLNFASWFESVGAVDEVCIWARGIDFDVAVMKSAYRACSIKQPWRYNLSRDSRTLFAVTPGFDPATIGDLGTAHNALDDATWEAKAVCHAYHLLGLRKVPEDKLLDHLITNGRPPISVSGDNGIQTSGKPLC